MAPIRAEQTGGNRAYRTQNTRRVLLRKDSIEHIVAIHQRYTNKHIFVIDFDPGKICLETDPEKFAEIFHILIYQAIKYSPMGGEIRFIARLEPPMDAFPYGSLLIQVKDQGDGFPVEWLSIHAERYIGSDIRLNRPVGLFLVKGIVEAHHGFFWPESEGVGKGTTFNVRIPVRQPSDVCSLFQQA